MRRHPQETKPSALVPEGDHTGLIATTSANDVFPPELARLLATAQKEIIEHGNDHGLCVVCGSAFPCPRAELAAFALDAV